MATSEAYEPSQCAETVLDLIGFENAVIVEGIGPIFCDTIQARVGMRLMLLDARTLTCGIDKISSRIRKHRNCALMESEHNTRSVSCNTQWNGPPVVVVSGADQWSIQKPRTETLRKHLHQLIDLANSLECAIIMGIVWSRSLNVAPSAVHKFVCTGDTVGSDPWLKVRSQFACGMHPLAQKISELVAKRASEAEMLASIQMHAAKFTRKQLRSFRDHYMLARWARVWRTDPNGPAYNAVEAVLGNMFENMKAICIVHGPPGCGKTSRIKAALHALDDSLEIKEVHTSNLLHFQCAIQGGADVFLIKVINNSKAYVEAIRKLCEETETKTILELDYPDNLRRQDLMTLCTHAGECVARCEISEKEILQHLRKNSPDCISDLHLQYIAKYVHTYSLLPGEAVQCMHQLTDLRKQRCRITKAIVIRVWESLGAVEIERIGEERMYMKLAMDRAMQMDNCQTGWALHQSSIYRNILHDHGLCGGKEVSLEETQQMFNERTSLT